MPALTVSTADIAANLTSENAAALAAGPLDGGQVWYEFLTQQDDRVRPSHRALHGTVWRAGDPAAPMPPLDYGCRCFISYRAAPGSAAAKVLPVATSEPTTQDAAFGAFLDGEASGWRTALAAAEKGPAGDILPTMAQYFQGTGMSAAQARDAARMAMAATQATRAIPATKPEPPTDGTLGAGSSPGGPVPSPGGGLAPLPPMTPRGGPGREVIPPTAFVAADKLAASKAAAKAKLDTYMAEVAAAKAADAAAAAKAGKAAPAKAKAGTDPALPPNATPTGSIPPNEAQRIAMSLYDGSMMPMHSGPIKRIKSGEDFGMGADRLAAMRAAPTLADARRLAERSSTAAVNQNEDERRKAREMNQAISATIAKTDPSTTVPIQRFTHGYDRYIRAADRGDSRESIIKDIIDGGKKGKGPLNGIAKDAQPETVRRKAEAIADNVIAWTADIRRAMAQEAFVRRIPVLYRGLHSLTEKQMLGIINGDKPFSLGGMSSTSTSADIASGFASQGGGQQVLLRLRDARGMPIRAESRYINEDEVIVGDDQKFRVVSVMADRYGDSRWIIDMEAVE